MRRLFLLLALVLTFAAVAQAQWMMCSWSSKYSVQGPCVATGSAGSNTCSCPGSWHCIGTDSQGVDHTWDTPGWQPYVGAACYEGVPSTERPGGPPPTFDTYYQQ